MEKAKDNIRGRLVLGLESSDEIAGYLAGQELMKREIITPDQLLSQIDKVSADDIMRVSKNIFRNDKLNLALIGPIEDTKFLENILRL